MVTVEVCVGSACYVKGSYNIISDMQELIAENELEGKVTVKAAFCLGECAKAVAVKFSGEDEVFSLSPKTTRDFFQKEVLSRLGA